jgi:hypothetical protein
LGKRFGVERLGFLTLTFKDNVQVIKEAQRRFNSLNTGVLQGRYEKAIGCWERQKSGRIHFHLVVVVASDIRTGFDFEAVERGDYKSANPALRSEWAFWRRTAPDYGFGRTELLPVKSTAEGIARYVGKYVSKHIGNREERDKGAKVVRFLGYAKPSSFLEYPVSSEGVRIEGPPRLVHRPGERSMSARFGWNSENALVWRAKLGTWCKANGISNLDELRKRVGKNWAWRLAGEIVATPLPSTFIYPSLDAYEAAREMETPAWWAYTQAAKILESQEFMTSYILQPFRALQRRSK